jgi:hypothetical protein
MADQSSGQARIGEREQRKQGRQVQADCPLCGNSFEGDNAVSLVLSIQDHIVWKAGGDEKHKVKEVVVTVDGEPWTLMPGSANDGQISQFR